jgi:RNA polymerase subunit RPABC4/transcription elongation factor Spt4
MSVSSDICQSCGSTNFVPLWRGLISISEY